MRKIINSTYITLDGVIENPQLWPSTGERDERFNAIQTDLLLSCDAILMGRHTYDAFAPVWPTQTGYPLADRMNTLPKYVVSNTLTDPQWNSTTVIPVSSAVDEISRLKAQVGGDIVQYGVGVLTYQLLEQGMVDELRLWVHPLFVGDAKPSDLMFRKSAAHTFNLAGVETLSNGIAILSYTAKSS